MSLKRINLFIVLISVFLFIIIDGAKACRFWAGVSENIPPKISFSHLISESNSLKSLGDIYDDGWAIGYYKQNDSIVLRGADSSMKDPDYDFAVSNATNEGSNVIVAHLRKASSGCVEGVPNPHPFERHKNDQNWLFGHNGTIKKETLIRLIGKDYLDKNPPVVCGYDAPKSWIDSELYFIYLLKNIEAKDWNVQRGIEAAIKKLVKAQGQDRKALNFFLTNGETIWSFKKGPSLYYQSSKDFSAVSSEPTEKEDSSWTELIDNSLVILKPGTKPEILNLAL